MQVDDIEFGMQLKNAAGWNQLKRDWQRLLAFDPAGCFVAAWDEQDVGTVATSVFGQAAWISMMLVAAEFRGRGVGRALMGRALEELASREVTTIRLDATPAGQVLYEGLGFKPDFELSRYCGIAGETRDEAHNDTGRVTAMNEADLPQVTRLDFDATGIHREKLLKALWRERPAEARIAGNPGTPCAFALSREGANGTLLGPCIGTAPDAAALFREALLRHENETVIVDIPMMHSPACEMASRAGLVIQRRLTRMTRGPRIAENPLNIWASSGPEKG